MDEMKRENVQLKEKLQKCIQKTEFLERSKRDLEKQKIELVREAEFQKRIVDIRKAQAKKKSNNGMQ